MADTALTRLSIAEARDGLLAKTFSARELVDAHIKAMERARGLNAFILETPDAARAGAEEADKRIANGRARALEGVPLGIKDLFCTDGVETTAASRILKGFTPPYESTVTRNLWDAGALMLGKTNMDEFAMGSSNTTSHFGAVENPWRRERDNRPLVPGGSSGGSAAAVAGHLCPGATGTDTGGSIRQPAAFCGVVGFKPTYGRCSRYGIVAFASSLDQAGPITRTVRDSAILLTHMAGFDPRDSTSVDREVPDFEAALERSVKGLKVGIPKEYRADGMDGAIEALWQKGVDWLKDAGAEAVEISLPHTGYALPVYYILGPAEASSNLARYDGVRYGHRAAGGGDILDMYEATRGEGFGAEVRRRVLIGTYVLSAGYYDAYYLKAQKVRTLIAGDFTRAFEGVDVILTPTTPGAAFAIGEKEDDPIAMYLNDVFTVPASLAGLPGVSLPVGSDADGLPLGLQLIGRPFDEETVLAAARAIEEQAGFDGSAAAIAGEGA